MCKLASRLPNPSMVVSCILVMLALPTSLGMVLYGAVMEAMNASAKTAGGDMTATVGFWVMELSLVAYISILFWFNRSFS
jgi:hypothetical protein